MPYVPDLDLILTAGHREENDEGTVFLIEPAELGPVVLPTGKVVGCDPLVPFATPFVDEVAPGRYDLRAWVAALSRDGVESQRRVAALQLVVVDKPVATWEMALEADQDPASLDDDDFFGYSVDSGTGTLADQVAIDAMSEWDFEQIEATFIPEETSHDPIESVVSAVVDEPTAANVYVVGSGWGDGDYATYVGRTEAGEIACFVTDFRVLPSALADEESDED